MGMGWMEGAGEHSDGAHPLELSRLSTPPPPWQTWAGTGVDSWVERWDVSGPGRLEGKSQETPGQRAREPGHQGRQQAGIWPSVRSSTTKRDQRASRRQVGLGRRLLYVQTNRRTVPRARGTVLLHETQAGKTNKNGEKERGKRRRQPPMMPSRLAGIRPFPSQRFGSKTPVVWVECS